MKTCVGEFVRAVRLKSADPDLIENVLPDFYRALRARNDPQHISEVSAAAFDALAAQAKSGSARAAFAAAILHVELDQAKVGVEQFINAVRLGSADDNMILEKLERIRMYLYQDTNPEYLKQVSATADEALKARADEKAAKEKKAPVERKQ